MKWKRTGRDSDLIDRRGGGSSRAGRGLQIGGGGGLVGIIVALAIVFLGGDPSGFAGMQVANGGPIPRAQDPEKDLRDFSLYVFSDAMDTWAKAFGDQGESFD